MESPTKSTTSWWFASVILVLLGATATGFLLAHHFSVAGGKSAAFDACKVVFGSNCDDALQSDIAMQLGIPLAGWGGVYYSMLSASILLTLLLGTPFRRFGTTLTLSLSLVGAAVSLSLLGIMLFGVTAFCSMCAVIHVVNCLLVPSVYMSIGTTHREVISALRVGCMYVCGVDTDEPTMDRWRLSMLVLIALVGTVVYQWVMIQGDRRAHAKSLPPSIDDVISSFDGLPVHEITVSEQDPQLGDPKASLRLVLFSDFECPACQRFAATIDHIRDHHPEMHVVYKHYPLGSACNAELDFDLHPLSCGAAAAAHAAHLQGKFWEYHDRLFKNVNKLDAAALKEAATDVGLDIPEFVKQSSSDATSEKIAADVALGNSLQLAGTPTVLLNGKILNDDAMPFLEELIGHVGGHTHAHD